MKRLVSRNRSTLIQLVPREFAPDPDFALQLRDDGIVTLYPPLLAGVCGEPLPELGVQRDVLRPGARAASTIFSSAVRVMFFTT